MATATAAAKPRYRSPTHTEYVETSLAEFSTEEITKELAHRRSETCDHTVDGEECPPVPRDDLETMRRLALQHDFFGVARTAQRIYCDALGVAV